MICGVGSPVSHAANRRLEELGPLELSVALVQRPPSVQRARRRNADRAHRRNARHSPRAPALSPARALSAIVPSWPCPTSFPAFGSHTKAKQSPPSPQLTGSTKSEARHSRPPPHLLLTRRASKFQWRSASPADARFPPPRSAPAQATAWQSSRPKAGRRHEHRGE